MGSQRPGNNSKSITFTLVLVKFLECIGQKSLPGEKTILGSRLGHSCSERMVYRRMANDWLCHRALALLMKHGWEYLASNFGIAWSAIKSSVKGRILRSRRAQVPAHSNFWERWRSYLSVRDPWLLTSNLCLLRSVSFPSTIYWLSVPLARRHEIVLGKDGRMPHGRNNVHEWLILGTRCL
jgi:hypothetical protein